MDSSLRADAQTFRRSAYKVVGCILGEDQFARVLESDAAPGDIVTWRRAEDIDHSGIVSSVETVAIRTVWVWSMWGELGEFVHRLRPTPYDDCTVEFWRLT